MVKTNGFEEIPHEHLKVAIEPAFPLPTNEAERLAALHSYHILDTAEEKDFDDLTQLASAICQTPVALVSLVDDDRQWFKSRTGVAISETPREYSFCAHAIASPDHVMVVKNAREDDRFVTNPLVTGETNLTFYAGVPLVNEDGFALGSLCVIDTYERELSQHQINALMILAKQVTDKLELRRKVTTLKATNTALTESYRALQVAHRKNYDTEHRFRSLVEQAPVALATLQTEELIIESANENILHVWGKDHHIIGQPLADALPELKGQPYLELLKKVFTTGETHYGSEAKATYERNGKSIEGFFNFVYQPLKSCEGKVEGILVIATEVTEQVASRKTLAEANHRLEIALDAAKFGSYDLDMLTSNMICTEQCKKNFGLAKEARFGFQDLFEAIVPEFREYVHQQINSAIANVTVYTAEYQVTWPDGSRHWIAAFGKPIFDEQGQPVRIIGVTQEITERKMLDQHKDDFLSIASHELKTPITSLKGSLQLLNRIKDSSTSATSTRLVELANKSVEKISTLVDQLLNFNRIDHDQLHLNKTSFSVAEMLNQCCNHVRLDGKYELVLEGDKNIRVFADEDRIDQVVINFVNNAIKYAPESKRIYLTVEQINNIVKVGVRDTGPGIAVERQPHIFKRYYRADHSGSNYSGLGLGLYIWSEIIQKHGGEIGVTSTEGQGSEFWFTLPLTTTGN